MRPRREPSGSRCANDQRRERDSFFLATVFLEAAFLFVAVRFATGGRLVCFFVVFRAVERLAVALERLTGDDDALRAGRALARFGTLFLRAPLFFAAERDGEAGAARLSVGRLAVDFERAGFALRDCGF